MGRNLEVGRKPENLPAVNSTYCCVLAIWNARVVARTEPDRAGSNQDTNTNRRSFSLEWRFFYAPSRQGPARLRGGEL